MDERGGTGEACPACGFDRSRHSRRDLVRTLHALPDIWQTMTEAAPAAILAEPPPDGGASVLDLVASDRDVVARRLGDGVDPPAPVARSMTEALGALETVVARAHARIRDLDDDGWAAAEPTVAAAVHETVHHLRAGG